MLLLLLLFFSCLVHRIGRTGRCGKTGVATTFINKSCGGNRCIIIFFDSAYFLLAVMVEGDESSQLRMAN